MNSNERILLFIADYKEKYAISPSVREISKGVGLSSSSTIHGHLHRLKRDRYIDFRRKQPRSIAITDAGKEYLKSIRRQVEVYG